MPDSVPLPADLLAHADFVRRLARALLGDAHAAEDVVQSTWLRGLERPPVRGGELRAWLARVARNLSLQRRRGDARRAQRELAAARPEAEELAPDSLARTELLQRVVDAVRALDEPYRATILARFYEDLPPRAIARRDGVSVETVNSRLKRGLTRLRERLGRAGSEWRGALGLLAGTSPWPPSGPAFLLAAMKTKLVIGSVVVLLAAWGAWRAVTSGELAPLSAGTRLSAVQVDEPAPAVAPLEPHLGVREPTPPAPTPAPSISGRVLSEHGEPVAGVRVQVLGEEFPFGDDYHPDGVSRRPLHGRAFESDAEGRWRAELTRPQRVLVAVETSETLDAVPGAGDERWVDPPASAVDFVVRRIPTGTVEARVVEGTARRPLEDFLVVLYDGRTVGPDGALEYVGKGHAAWAEDGVARCALGIREPGGRRLHAVLAAPDVRRPGAWLAAPLEERPADEVLLHAGETAEVVFELPERGVVHGVVIDERGTPIADALVFFGEETHVRGDEPFKPVRAERIRDGARTGADGAFEVRGEGPRITAVHPRFCGATVRVEDAGRIVLAERGAIRGRLHERDGSPVAGRPVFLGNPSDNEDQSVRAVTDDSGAFRFDGVDAGAHALWRPVDADPEQEFLACVRVGPGEEVEVELRVGELVPIELDLSAFAPDEPELDGVIVGLDRISGLIGIQDGIVEGGLRPGRYWLATMQGIDAPLVVEAGDVRVRVEPGSATLVVRSERRANVQVAPMGADAYTRLMAARAWVKAEGATEARFRLAPGSYALVGDAGRVLLEVDLPPEGRTVELQ